MKQKRLWSMVLAVLMLMSMVPTVQAAAVPTVTLSGGEVQGDTITLTANITGNPGLAIYQLYFYFDTDVFEVADLEAAGQFLKDGSELTNEIAVAVSKNRYDGKAGEDGMLLLWYSSRGTDSKADGGMATITLRFKDDTRDGNYAIGLGYSAKNTLNEEGQRVALQTTGVNVRVGSGTSVETEKPAETEKPVTPEENETVVFEDIAGNWAEEYILEAAERGLVNGKKPGIFDPNANMTRAEFMMILWRAVGSPTPKGAASFTDLTQAWYLEPIAWAEENNITNGTSPTTFDPNGNVTREQMMTILHRMAGTPSCDPFMAMLYDQMIEDRADLHDWAKEAVYWAAAEGILSGEQTVDPSKVVAPRAAATRSQIAVSIIKYLDR